MKFDAAIIADLLLIGTEEDRLMEVMGFQVENLRKIARKCV